MRTAVYMASLAYFLIYQPIGGAIGHRKFMRAVLHEPTARIKYYRQLIGEIIAASAVVFLLMFAGWYSASDIGISLPGFTAAIDRWVACGVLVVLGVYAVLIVYQVVMARISQPYRAKLSDVALSEDILLLMPRTRQEKRLWTWVSLTAGLFEELLYRGYLLYLIRFLIPDINVYLCLAVMAVVFGLGHAYQGASGVLKTAFYGLLLSALYLVTGSILPGMVLHFLNDYAAKDVGGASSTQAAES